MFYFSELAIIWASVHQNVQVGSAPIKDSDMWSLIRVFNERSLGSQGSNVGSAVTQW